MNLKWILTLMSILMTVTWAFSGFATEVPLNSQRIRKSAVSGRFYPENPRKLTAAVIHYLKSARRSSENKPLVMIAPHAGYIYSGQICADAFNQAKGHAYDLIVLLGTNHTSGRFRRISVYPDGGFETPLGIVPIDEVISEKLISGSPDVIFDDSVHRTEHSIEVMLPFVQTLFPHAKIVAAIVGSADLKLCERFGKLLVEVIKTQNRDALIVASSDLSHYPSYADALTVDHEVLSAILSLDPTRLKSNIDTHMKKEIPNLGTCACGEAPILSAMTAAKKMGATCPRLVSYANSGDAAIGDRDRVVGYGAVAFFQDSDCPSPQILTEAVSARHEGPIDQKRQTVLLQLARDSIYQYLTTETAPLPRSDDTVLKLQRGAFVTLKKHGRLRGCIGHMAEDFPLCRTVSAMALQAAFNDRRFSPVTLEELRDLEIEISVLTPFRRVEGPKAIQVGRDGVVLQKGVKRAVFLPQVAVEQGWDRDTMLDHLCGKAGLSPGSWKNGAELFTFQAQVFSESEVMKTQ